jgi:hemerythrin-like domain-containing protein
MAMSAAEPIDVRDMKIVHETFRRAYDESAQLVRANPTPSSERVTFLADHIDFGIGMLHHHHESEDELLYPLLVERVPEQAAMTTEVEHQHKEVTSAIEAASAACATWRQQPSAETGESLAAALNNLNTILRPHLDDEESKIVPLAAVTLTQKEWTAMGEHSRAAIPRDRMPVAFGMLLEPLDESDRAYMKSELPAPVRLLFPLLIQRPWNKYKDTLRNGT